jgi:hypothetical protein
MQLTWPQTNYRHVLFMAARNTRLELTHDRVFIWTFQNVLFGACTLNVHGPNKIVVTCAVVSVTGQEPASVATTERSQSVVAHHNAKF